MEKNPMNVFYRNIRSFGSLYGTTIVYGGKYRPSLYEEQRFGINYTEKPSIIRKNFTTVKRITLGARPLTSVINMDKFGIIESRNQEEMNRTFDHQDFPKFNNDNKDPVEVGDEREEVVPGVALSKKMAHCGDNINLSIKFPELRVFTCNEKQGIKPLTTYVIDEENLASKTEKNKKSARTPELGNDFNVKEALLFLISQFSVDDGMFCFPKNKLCRDQWERIFTETIYNEEICIFREDGDEYLLVIKKPTIEYQNITKNYCVHIFPVSGTNTDELAPEDITYNEILNWVFTKNEEWIDRCLEYIDTFGCLDTINEKAAANTKKRVFILNKYEDLRNFTNENDRYREVPCNIHCFYAKFSKYDIRKVKSLHIQLDFKTTGIKREFIYTFDEFLEFFKQDKDLCEDALVESMKDFYSDTGNLSSYFRILTIDTSATITFPHIEDSKFETNGDYTKVYVQDYIDLFGHICGNQSHILMKLEKYIPKIDWRTKLGQFYYPY